MKRHLIISLAIVSLVFLFFANLSYAALAGKISFLEGRVDVLKTGRNMASPAKTGDPVDTGDIYRAKSDGRAEITFMNGNILKIAPRTRAEIKEAMFEGDKSSSVVKLHRGRVQATSSDEFIKKVSAFAEGNKFEVHTPNAVAGIRGSSMLVSFERNATGTLFSIGKGYMFNPNDPQKKIVNIVGGTISFVTTPTGSPTPPRPATNAEIAIMVNAVTTIGKPKNGGDQGQQGSGGTTTGTGTGGTTSGTGIASTPTTTGVPSAGSFNIAAVGAPPPAPAPTPPPPPPPPPPEPPAPVNVNFKSDISTSLWQFAGSGGTLFGTVTSPLYIKLTWGATPSDLDANAWITGYHVYYSNKGTLSAYPYAQLDQDITSGYGPETITIYQFAVGNTHYAVENFSGRPSITGSSAVVVIKDASGNVIVTYTVPTTGTGDWWHVFNIAADSSGSGSLYSLNGISDSGTPSWRNDGSITATMTGSGRLWTQGVAVPVTVTGRGGHIGGGGSHKGNIASSVIYSQNNLNNTRTTSDGGSYYGIFSGSGVDNNITALIAALYIDPSGNAGYIKGRLTGSGASDDTFRLSGNVYSAKIMSGFTPSDLRNIDIRRVPDYAISGSGSFAAGGTIPYVSARDGLYHRTISNQNWGIWDAQLGLMYSGATGNDWTLSINMDNPGNNIQRLEVRGTQWSDKTLAGKVSGYGAGWTPTGDARTWIYFGDIVGSFDPSVSSAQSVLTGVFMGTNRYLELASTDAGRASLQALNIPCVQVGIANLSGSGNNLTVNMNDVKFFSTTAGSVPRAWATGNVNGTYTGTPCTSTPVNISGSGLSAQFNVSRWDTSAKVWVSHIANGTGNLSGGSYNGAVTFKGAGSGPITPATSTSGTFSGTATGLSR